MRKIILLSLTMILMASCQAGTTAPTVPSNTETTSPTLTAALEPGVTPSPLPTDTPIPSATPTLAPDAWMHMPVIPETVTARTLEIYTIGQAMGNNPQAFSRMGDCDSLPFSFLGDFDEGEDAYNLGDYGYLADVIAYFQGSYLRQGVTARDAFNTAAALIPPWGGNENYQKYSSQCLASETAMDCEIRLHRPSFMLIALGTNDYGQPERFERNMRLIIENLITKGVVPILGTKGDNLEGDHEINAIMGQLAYEYSIPLWNFWAAIQELPNHGIRADDGYHPTHPGFDDGMPNDFSSAYKLTFAFPWRNLTALQILDLLMRDIYQ